MSSSVQENQKIMSHDIYASPLHVMALPWTGKNVSTSNQSHIRNVLPHKRRLLLPAAESVDLPNKLNHCKMHVVAVEIKADREIRECNCTDVQWWRWEYTSWRLLKL